MGLLRDRTVNQIVVHCSATPNGRETTVADIDGWHAARGFKRGAEAREHFNPELGSIGYHYVVYVSGKVATGRHVSEIGAHVAGANARSLGLCLIGTDAFAAPQWVALTELVRVLLVRNPVCELLGHRDHSPDKNGDGKVEPWEFLKDCPGFDVREWRKANFAAPAEHILQIEGVR